MENVLQIISTVGFPIFACIALGFFIYKNNENQDQRYMELSKDFREQVAQFTKVVEQFRATVDIKLEEVKQDIHEIKNEIEEIKNK